MSLSEAAGRLPHAVFLSSLWTVSILRKQLQDAKSHTATSQHLPFFPMPFAQALQEAKISHRNFATPPISLFVLHTSRRRSQFLHWPPCRHFKTASLSTRCRSTVSLPCSVSAPFALHTIAPTIPVTHAAPMHLMPRCPSLLRFACFPCGGVWHVVVARSRPARLLALYSIMSFLLLACTNVIHCIGPAGARLRHATLTQSDPSATPESASSMP